MCFSFHALAATLPDPVIQTRISPQMHGIEGCHMMIKMLLFSCAVFLLFFGVIHIVEKYFAKPYRLYDKESED